MNEKKKSPLRRTGPVRRSKNGGWTEEEDILLRAAVEEFKGKSWKKIAKRIPNRSNVQCLHRWQKVLNPNLVKGFWTAEEDELIRQSVNKFGCDNWSVIAQSLHGRIGKQCRERWYNHLDPSIDKSEWSEEEIAILLEKQEEWGNKWAEIAKLLPGRPNNQCKNVWNSLKSKRSKKRKRKRSNSAKLPRAKRQKIVSSEPIEKPLRGLDTFEADLQIANDESILEFRKNLVSSMKFSQILIDNRYSFVPLNQQAEVQQVLNHQPIPDFGVDFQMQWPLRIGLSPIHQHSSIEISTSSTPLDNFLNKQSPRNKQAKSFGEY